MAEKNLSVKLSLNDKQFQSSLRKSTRKLKKFGDGMKRAGDSVLKNFTAPLLGFGAVAVKLASDFKETESKFNVVFRDIRDEADETADNLKNNFGLSGKAALQLLGDTGDLLTGFGFTQEEALKLSNQVNELAVDLASFTNFSGGAEGASLALTKALLGERESIKSLGIAITEGDLKTFAAEQGLVFKELDRVAKATLTYKLAIKQSQNALGDHARTSEEFANQMRILKGNLEDVGAEIGMELLPIAQSLVNVLGDLTNFTKQFTSEQKQGAIETAGYVSGLALVGSVVGRLIKVFASLKSFFLLKLIPIITGVFNAFKLLTPQGRVIGAALAAATFLTANYDKVVGVFDKVKEAIVGVKEESKGLNFDNQNITPDTSIIDDMRSGKAVNPVTGQPFFTPPPPPPPPAEKRPEGLKMVDGLDFKKIDPKPIQLLSVEFKHLAKNFKLASVELQDFSHIITSTEAMAANMKSAFMSFGQTMQGVFAQALQSSDGFFKAIVDGAKQAFQALIAQLIAMIAMKAIMTALGFGSLDLAATAGSNAVLGMIGLADGGLATGPTVAMVGEGPGTTMSNPEVIAPLDKLKSMIGESGGGNVQVFGTIKGSDILLSSDRAKNNRNRTRGY
tara:strand:- start:1205 stop:3070 length:1866 start_codon:yes stop_codon:yes gene_type:complete